MDAHVIEVKSQYSARAFGQSAFACDRVKLHHLTREGLRMVEKNLLNESRRQRAASQTERGGDVIEIDLCDGVELGWHEGELRDTSDQLAVISEQ